VLYNLCGDAQTAEDLVHETYLRLWERRDRVTIGGSPVAYLCAIGCNLWRNQRRHRDVARRIGAQLAAEESVDGRPERHERKQAVADAIAALPQDLREVLTLRIPAEMTFEEIARVLETPTRTLEARMKRALDRLRADLKDPLKDANP
jgi:RNA polymerase sigma-70 factor (ECF subfamily)